MANLSMSESAKLGVTGNGGHFDRKAEYVPIKKRRFLYRSPSPPPPPSSNSPRSSENDMPEKTECRFDQESLTCQDVALGQTVEAIVDVNMKLNNENDHMPVNEDLSGISILANAACSIDLGQEEEFQWDLNEAGTDQLDYEDLDRETDTTDAISRSPASCNVSDKMKNNEAMGSPHLSETCDANQSGVALDTVADQVRTSGHDNTDIVIPPNDPASLGEIQVQDIPEFKINYDSEYEDGELIESIKHTWEECDVEDGEAEHVSHESEDVERFGSNAFNRQVSMSEGAKGEKLRLTDINSSPSVEAFSLKNVHKPNFQNEANISRGSNVKLDNGSGRLLHSNENHRKNEWNNLNRAIELNIGQIGRGLLPKSCKSSINLEEGFHRGFIDRRNIEGKVFESRPIRKEFQSRVNNFTNNGMSLREFRVQGSRFNDFNESKSRYDRDWNAHKSFGPGSERNWRQTRNSTDRPIKRVRSPSGSPTIPRGRYTRDYRGGFDDRDSDNPHHLVGRERSFSPAENPIDFHRPYRRNSFTSPDFRSRDRNLNLKTPHLNAGFSQRSDKRCPTRIIPSDEAYGVSDSPQRVNQNNYYRPRHHERFSRIDGGDHRYEENDYDQRHGYRYKHIQR